MSKNQPANPNELKRLGHAGWYRNLAGRWDNEISLYHCPHICLLMLGPISNVDGDITGPCCDEAGRYSKSDLPLTWRFPPSFLNVIDSYTT